MDSPIVVIFTFLCLTSTYWSIRLAFEARKEAKLYKDQLEVVRHSLRVTLDERVETERRLRRLVEDCTDKQLIVRVDHLPVDVPWLN